MTEEKRLEVADWSQPYKLAVYAIAILGFAGFVYWGVMPWAREVLVLLRQIVNK